MATVFIFDGDCAFCTACAQFISRRIPTPARIVPWQWADLAELGLDRQACETAVQWVDTGPDGQRTTSAGPVAIAALLRTSTPMWRAAGWLLARRPVLWVAWPGYRWVARNRHRMPGGTAACAVPRTAAPPAGDAQ